MKIICIGRNYVKHIEELKNEVPGEPVVFMKPDSSLLLNNKPFYLPGFSSNLHHEVELVLKISKVGKNIEEKFAHRYYDCIHLGVDFTARDLQDKLRSQGLPWEKSKAFDDSAVLSNTSIPVEELEVKNIDFSLNINGIPVQKGNSSQMIYPFDAIVSHVSKFFTIKTGDLIFTGTPSGVGPITIGDRLEGYIGGKKMFDFYIK